jgi:hypothetical protein
VKLARAPPHNPRGDRPRAASVSPAAAVNRVAPCLLPAQSKMMARRKKSRAGFSGQPCTVPACRRLQWRPQPQLDAAVAQRDHGRRRSMSASTTVRGLDGETFELRHAPGAGLAELKRLIAQQTGIDPSQQNISRGGRAVIDTEEEEEEEEDGEDDSKHRAKDELAASLERRLCCTPVPAQHVARPAAGCCERPCGFENIGGTSCYLNAALQTMLAVEELARPEFYARLLRGSAEGSRRSRLAKAIAALVTMIVGSSSSTSSTSTSSTTPPPAEGAATTVAPAAAVHTPAYLHALLSNGATGLASAERFSDGAAADCGAKNAY